MTTLARGIQNIGIIAKQATSATQAFMKMEHIYHAHQEIVAMRKGQTNFCLTPNPKQVLIQVETEIKMENDYLFVLFSKNLNGDN